MSRYVVVLLLQPVAVGDSFITREWPLHVTLLPVFASPATPAELGDRLAAAAGAAEPVAVVAGADEGFGPAKTIPVTVIEPNPDLDALHAAFMTAIENAEPEYENPEFTGPGYRAHVTIKRYERVTAGDRLMLEQVALVDMEPGQPGGGRTVLTVATLGR
jgi:2'-5' RNA ligase